MLARVMRSGVARWLAAVLLAPMLVLPAFSGAKFLAHWHEDDGMHLHPVGLIDDGECAAVDHADHHGHDHSGWPTGVPAHEEEDCVDLAQARGGVIIFFDISVQPPTRSLSLGKPLSRAAIFAIVAFVLPTSPDLDPHVGSPGGALNSGPMNLLALRAGDRLVRTSCALLI